MNWKVEGGQMHKTLIDFFENRVECVDPNKNYIEDYSNFMAMYEFINPLIPIIDNMVIDNEYSYRLYIDKDTHNIEEGIFELVDRSTVEIDGLKYKATSTLENDCIRITLDREF